MYALSSSEEAQIAEETPILLSNNCALDSAIVTSVFTVCARAFDREICSVVLSCQAHPSDVPDMETMQQISRFSRIMLQSSQETVSMDARPLRSIPYEFNDVTLHNRFPCRFLGELE